MVTPIPRFPDEVSTEPHGVSNTEDVSTTSLVGQLSEERQEALRHALVMRVVDEIIATDAEILDRLAKM